MKQYTQEELAVLNYYLEFRDEIDQKHARQNDLEITVLGEHTETEFETLNHVRKEYWIGKTFSGAEWMVKVFTDGTYKKMFEMAAWRRFNWGGKRTRNELLNKHRDNRSLATHDPQPLQMWPKRKEANNGC